MPSSVAKIHHTRIVTNLFYKNLESQNWKQDWFKYNKVSYANVVRRQFQFQTTSHVKTDMKEGHSKLQTSDNDKIGYDCKFKKKAKSDIGMFKGRRNHTTHHDSAKMQSVVNEAPILKCKNTRNKTKDKGFKILFTPLSLVLKL